MEEAGPNGSITFLDNLITPKADGTLTTEVYRKPSHTDQYLQWDSNHNLASKYSVINTLTHRARTLCSTPQLINKEFEHLEEVLRGCKYPRWAIKKILHKQKHQQDKTNKKKQHQSSVKKVAIWWFHIPKELVKVSRTFVEDMEYRYISKEEKPLQIY